MDILSGIKKVVSKVKTTLDEAAEVDATETDLHKWKKRLEMARAHYPIELMDEREYIYLGSHGVDKNINSRQMPSKDANTVYNIVFEFIETQVNTQIPQPSVKSIREPFVDQAHMVEDAITDKLKQMETEDVTDAQERITPVQGYSIMELCWNNDIHHHLYTGDMELYNRHPKQLIPQPGVFRLQQMDYFFVLSRATPEYIKRRYGVDAANQTEQYTDHTTLSGITQSAAAEERSLTEIVCWYKDEDGDICKLVWVNDTVCEDLPKYYYRRDADGAIMLAEQLTEPKVIASGDVLQPLEEVPYYIPDVYPFIVRRNVPRNFDFGGQSDLDVIRDHQDSLKKVVSKMEEKIIKAGSIIKAAEDMNVEITDQTYQVIRGSVQQLQAIGVENLQADISRDIQYTEVLYKQAQSMLGITNAFQGKEDSTAKSGVAKQIQVQQASGRLQSKQFNKNAAYKELFELMFKFMLAFYDEPRAYLSKDQYGNTQYAEFDRYRFLVRDASGELYYNTDFLFSADVGSGLPKDPIFVYNQCKEQLGMGAIDKLQYWTILDYLNFPMAKQIKAQIEQQMQQQAEMAQQQAMAQQAQQPTFDDHMANLSPEQKGMWEQLPPEEQQAIMQQMSANQN